MIHFKDVWCIKKHEQPKENICDEYNGICCECDNEQAEYEYNDKIYCNECLLKEFNVTSATETHYYCDGEYLESEDDMTEVISNLDRNIKEIE